MTLLRYLFSLNFTVPIWKRQIKVSESKHIHTPQESARCPEEDGQWWPQSPPLFYSSFTSRAACLGTGLVLRCHPCFKEGRQIKSSETSTNCHPLLALSSPLNFINISPVSIKAPSSQNLKKRNKKRVRNWFFKSLSWCYTQGSRCTVDKDWTLTMYKLQSRMNYFTGGGNYKWYLAASWLWHWPRRLIIMA